MEGLKGGLDVFRHREGLLSQNASGFGECAVPDSPEGCSPNIGRDSVGVVRIPRAPLAAALVE